jgi:hypothetical protein
MMKQERKGVRAREQCGSEGLRMEGVRKGVGCNGEVQRTA